MAWKEKSDRCTQKDLDDFRAEWDALKNTGGRDRAICTLVEFETRWLGYCPDCAKPMPKTKHVCPECGKSRF